MAWDSTKSTAADPDNPAADEQNPASEWNEMITYLKARVGNTLFDAYSILYADVDDTPVALTVAASRIIGRKATGGIAAMTAAELIAMVGQWGDADTVDGCDAGTLAADVYKVPSCAIGTTLYFDGTGLNGIAAGAEGKVLTAHGAGPPTWGTSGGAGDMLKATYDPNDDGVIAVANGGTGVTGDTYDADKVDGCHAGNGNDQVWKIASGDVTHSIYVKVSTGVGALAPGTDGHQLTTHSSSGPPSWEAPGGYSHPSARQCTTGNWAWASISGKPSTYPPSAHNQSASTITSGTLPVSRGGTGVTGDTYDADKVDGCDAGVGTGKVYKVPAFDGGEIFYGTAGNMSIRSAGTDGYQLTTHAMGNAPTWAAASDLIFSDTHCPKCGKKFEDGDNLILHVIGHNEVGDILTIPMHQSCAAEPKKTVMIKRKVMEDQYVLDERTGEPKMQRVQKTQEKTVMKHKMKEGYVLDNKSGKALKIDEDGKIGKTKYNLADALEAVEETFSEVVYEDVEFLI